MRNSLLLLLLVSMGAQSDQVVTPDRVTPLFNGKDLSNWDADVPARDTNPNAPASFLAFQERSGTGSTPGVSNR